MKSALLIAALVLSAAPAVAAPNSEGRFVRSFMRDSQPHRVYFREACGGGFKDAIVTLQGKTTVVQLLNDGRSAVEHLYFTRKVVAKRALRQARRGLGQVDCLKS